MRWNTFFAMMLAVGSLTATAARAQDESADVGTATSEAKAATPDARRYGMDFNQPTTVDANGIPVAKPNPMSRYLDESRQIGSGVEMPLVTDPRTDAPPTDGQAH